MKKTRSTGFSGVSVSKFGYFSDYKRFDGPPPRTSNNKEYCFPDKTDDRSTHPYSYSPFFHWKSPDWKKIDNASYDDRMRQWDYDKWNAVRSRLSNGRFEYVGQEELNRMLTEYFDKPMICTALVEGCNVGNGYPYYVFYYREQGTPK
jgi:hypothetical protein